MSIENRGILRAVEPAGPPTTTFTAGPSVMGLTTFERGGVESRRALAYVHPHGSSLEWAA